MSLPRMGKPLMPKKCHYCSFFEAEMPMNVDYLTALLLIETFCVVDPNNRRKTIPMVAMNMVDDECPFWDEMSDGDRENGR